jgi:hypothetical protein
MKKLPVLLFCLVGLTLNAQPQYEWNVENTSTSPGERIVAIIDAGDIGSYDGVEIIGTVVDNNGNWGYALPTVASFKMYVRFSAPQSYKIIQSERTNYITLRLRKVTDSKYHLTANCPYTHRGMRVFFQQVEGLSYSVSVTMGSPTVNDPSGELVISEPEYLSSFTGKVSINTTIPDAELTVKGNIHAQEVKVDLAGAVAPDYVFEDGYDNMKIEDITEYVKEEKHLPGIPSATDMESDGIDLKQMNLLLLRKVEELTLHLIEVNEKVRTLEKKLETLE